MIRFRASVAARWLAGIFLLLGAGVLVSADDVRSLKELNELLQPEPYINLGSDGVLTQLPAETAAIVARGQAVYRQYCASCHGANLQGQANWNKPGPNGVMLAPPHDRTGHTWHHADDQLFEYVKYGPAVALANPEHRSSMPAFSGVLEDSEILSVLVFIRSSWPDEERTRQAAINDDQSGR